MLNPLFFFFFFSQTGDAGPIFNCAAQTWNHTFYWHSLAPNAGGAPTGAIKDAIERDFGSFDKFKEEFTAAASGHFGSGWAWLVQDPETKKLKVVQTHDAGSPLRDGSGKPILTCDVWEHAYYIDFRNDRPKYIAGTCLPLSLSRSSSCFSSLPSLPSA